MTKRRAVQVAPLKLPRALPILRNHNCLNGQLLRGYDVGRSGTRFDYYKHQCMADSTCKPIVSYLLQRDPQESADFWNRITTARELELIVVGYKEMSADLVAVQRVRILHRGALIVDSLGRLC